MIIYIYDYIYIYTYGWGRYYRSYTAYIITHFGPKAPRVIGWVLPEALRQKPVETWPWENTTGLPMVWSNALHIMESVLLPSGKQTCHMSIEHLTFADHFSKATIFQSQSWLIWLVVNPIHILSDIPWVWCFHIAAWTDMDARKRSEALSKMIVRTQPPQKDKANPTYMIYMIYDIYIYDIWYIWSHNISYIPI